MPFDSNHKCNKVVVKDLVGGSEVKNLARTVVEAIGDVAGGKVVRAFRLLKEFGIDINETIQFQNIEFDQDDIMILDLRSAKISTRGSANRRSVVKMAN